MALTLQVSALGQTLTVELEGSASVDMLKGLVAKEGGLVSSNFMLEFEGEAMEEGKAVWDYPLQDQSGIVVVVAEKEKALMRLEDAGYAGKDETNVLWDMQHCAKENHRDCALRHDRKYYTALVDMRCVGKCDNMPVLSSVFCYASMLGFDSCMRYLSENFLSSLDVSFALFHACRKGNTQCVSHLLSLLNPGFDEDSEQRNFIDTKHGSPLCCAARNGHVECLRLLLSHRHSEDEISKAVCSATRSGHSVCVEVLDEALSRLRL